MTSLLYNFKMLFRKDIKNFSKKSGFNRLSDISDLLKGTYMV